LIPLAHDILMTHNEADEGKRFPSDLSKSGAIKKTADGFTYLDPTQFHDYFAADLSAEQAAFMARSQVLNAADNFKAVITTATWRGKPSWMLVAAKDRTINPELERWYARRAHSHTAWKVPVEALKELQLIDEQIGQLDQEMASLLKQHQDSVQRLAEVPGLGPDSAQQIIAE
jgi:transposase